MQTMNKEQPEDNREYCIACGKKNTGYSKYCSTTCYKDDMSRYVGESIKEAKERKKNSKYKLSKLKK